MEIEALRLKREGEKDVFYQNIRNEGRLMFEASLDQKRNMKANQAVIEQQIAASNIVKTNQVLIDKQYYKPHFGPEETTECILKINNENARKKQFINREL